MREIYRTGCQNKSKMNEFCMTPSEKLKIHRMRHQKGDLISEV